MRLYRVIVPVRGIEHGAQFYSVVLGEAGQRVSGGRHYFGDPSGGAILACYSPRDDGDGPKYGESWQQHPQQYLYLSCDDLEGARSRCIAAGASEVTEIAKMPWGETMFYAIDPFGNPISFVKAGTEFTGLSG